jgi:hypothetical protein
MSDEQNLDTTVNSILNQLKTVPSIAKKPEKFAPNLSKEELENFIIQYTSRLVQNATESVEMIKDNVQMAPTSEDVISLAELIKSTSGAIDILNKMAINKDKINTSVKIKEMEIQNKKEELDTKVGLVVASREEMMKQLMNKSKVIDITPEN